MTGRLLAATLCIACLQFAPARAQEPAASAAATALALTAAAGAEAPLRARATLFIGNDNVKGGAAVASLLRQLGRPIAAPQGTLRAGGGCARCGAGSASSSRILTRRSIRGCGSTT